MKSTFETIRLFFHRPVGLVELLILYARVQFCTHQDSNYRLSLKTEGICCYIHKTSSVFLSFIYQANVKYFIYKVYAAICTRHHQFSLSFI